MSEQTNTPVIIQKKTIMANSWGGIYGLAFIGASIYFIQHATTFWDGVIGIGKAIFWPSMLIYKLFEYLKL